MGRNRRRKPKAQRIVAVSHADETTVYIHGYGRYLGLEVPPLALIQYHPLADQLYRNGSHKLLMDSGRVIWGHQCFWGLKDAEFDTWVAGRELVVVNDDDEP